MIKNEKEIRYFAPARSGYHAVVNWIIEHHRPPCFFLNLSLPHKEIRDREITPRHMSIHTKFKGYTLDEMKREVWPYPAQDIAKLKRKRLFLHSIESPKDWPEEASLIDQGNPPWYRGESEEKWNIVHLRDPFNNLASLIEKRAKVGAELKYEVFRHEFVGLAKEWLGETNFLTGRTIPVLFNSWFLSEEYRMELGEQIGLLSTCSRQYEDVLWGPGDGSSFDDFKYKHSASKMKVMERYKQHIAHPLMKQMIEDEELLYLAEGVLLWEWEDFDGVLGEVRDANR